MAGIQAGGLYYGANSFQSAPLFADSRLAHQFICHNISKVMYVIAGHPQFEVILSKSRISLIAIKMKFVSNNLFVVRMSDSKRGDGEWEQSSIILNTELLRVGFLKNLQGRCLRFGEEFGLN